MTTSGAMAHLLGFVSRHGHDPWDQSTWCMTCTAIHATRLLTLDDVANQAEWTYRSDIINPVCDIVDELRAES